MTTCGLGGRRISFGFGCRVEHLVTVEVQSSQDNAQDENEGVGGYGNGHDRRERERSTNKRETKGEIPGRMMGQYKSVYLNIM